MTVSGVGGEQAVVSDEMGTRSRHQGGEASDEVLGFEQHLGSAIGEGMFQLVDHQSITIDARALLGSWRASHVAAQALEFAALTGFAADGGIDGKPISCGGERLARCRLIEHRARVAKRHGLAPGLGPTAIR